MVENHFASADLIITTETHGGAADDENVDLPGKFVGGSRPSVLHVGFEEIWIAGPKPVDVELHYASPRLRQSSLAHPTSSLSQIGAASCEKSSGKRGNRMAILAGPVLRISGGPGPHAARDVLTRADAWTEPLRGTGRTANVRSCTVSGNPSVRSSLR